MVRIRTSGGLVVHKEKLLFIYKRDKWDLPKGKIKQGQTKKDAALIEVEEETGLSIENLKIVQKLIPTYYFKYQDEEYMLKKTSWYLIKYKGNPDKTLVYDNNEGITDCRWFKIDELNEVKNNTFPRIKYILDFYISMQKINNHHIK